MVVKLVFESVKCFLNDGAEDERTFAIIMCTLKFVILVQAFEEQEEEVVNFILIIYQFIYF